MAEYFGRSSLRLLKFAFNIVILLVLINTARGDLSNDRIKFPDESAEIEPNAIKDGSVSLKKVRETTVADKSPGKTPVKHFESNFKVKTSIKSSDNHKFENTAQGKGTEAHKAKATTLGQRGKPQKSTISAATKRNEVRKSKRKNSEDYKDKVRAPEKSINDQKSKVTFAEKGSEIHKSKVTASSKGNKSHKPKNASLTRDNKAHKSKEMEPEKNAATTAKNTQDVGLAIRPHLNYRNIIVVPANCGSGLERDSEGVCRDVF